MTTRTSGETVTFRHPFRLSGADEVQPAGRYLVETDEERLQSVSFPAYRRLATLIHLAGRPDSNEAARVVDVDPAELAAALARDAQAPEAAAATRTDRALPLAHEGTRGAREFVTDAWKSWVARNATELRWTALVAGGVVLAGLFAGGGSALP